MKRLSPYLALALICISMTAPSDTLRHEPLFKIERSKNANIVQYDAQIGPDGKLDSIEPVIAYWVRLADEGQIKQLTWLQRTFAFGFKARYDPITDSAPMEMAVDIEREFAVVRDGDVYRAKTTIDGAASFLDKIFISSRKKGFFITVDYVDIYGKDAITGEERFEHFVP